MDDCRELFQWPKGLDAAPLGIDMWFILMDDEKPLQSLVEPNKKNPGYFWAFGVAFDPEKRSILKDTRDSLKSGLMP